MSKDPSAACVAVKFHRKIVLPYERGAERALAGADRERWLEIASRIGPIELDPLFGVPREAIDGLLDRARTLGKGSEPPHLLGWFTITCPREAAEEAVRAFRGWPAVADSYIAPDAPPPQAVGFSNDPIESSQGFHRAAPEGIDARYAWGVASGAGGRVGLVVVDNAFDLTQPDLSDPIGWPFGPGNVFILHGQNQPDNDGVHGSAALAVAMARDNTVGGVGVAPEARAFGSCTLNTRNPPRYSTAEAIVAGATINPDPLNFTGPRAGDVVLLEVGFIGPLDDANPQESALQPMLPAEAEPPVFDAIRAATDAGIIVVEPAGNSDIDLDQVRRDGKALLDRRSPDFRDSGAIMVSAAFSGASPGTTPRARIIIPGTLHPETGRRDAVANGSRIDCFAWGDNVQTGLTGPGSTIGNTSGAGAIVAGAIVSTQSIAEHFLGSPCPPAQVRALFSDPALNTPSADPATDRIGVMPNLRRIIRRGLGILPEVELVLRDFLSDDGWSAAPVALGNSPDIIVRRTMTENAQAELGDAGVRPANAGSLADPSFVYLRAGNLGSRQASDVTAVVYWTGIDALLDPSRWHLIGTAQFPPVSPDPHSVTVSYPLEWNGSQTPMPLFGECMLIAFLQGDWQWPPTPWPAFASEDGLRAFVGASNNMATRKLALQAYLQTWWSWLIHTLLTTVRRWLLFTRG